MTPFDQQFESLRLKHPEARTTALPSGARLVEVPSVPLPAGWNRTQVTVYFLAPPGYPGAQPDCFWTDEPPLKLADRLDQPQNSAENNPIPEVGMKGTWFSWHLQRWNPNQDSLQTYMNVILQRLDPAR